jgi:CHAT domain-containing protein
MSAENVSTSLGGTSVTPTQPKSDQLAHARALLRHAPRTALDLARAHAHDAQTDIDLAHALLMEGQCLNTLGHLHEASAVLEQAEQRFGTLGDAVGAACCARERGVVLYWQGNYPVAETLFEAALDVLEHAAPVEAAQCLCWLATMTSFQLRVDAATAYVERAWALIDPDTHPFEAALCVFVQGINAQRLSRSDEAEATLNDAAARFAALDEQIWHARVLTQQGFLWFAQQDLERATAVTERARGILQACGSQHYVAMTTELLGKIATTANEWERAYALIAEAASVYQSQGMEVLAAQAGLHRANVDYWLDAWGDAERGYAAMSEVARRRGAFHHIVTSESNLGLLALNGGRHDQALLHTHAALEQAVALELKGDQSRCHRQLGNIYGTLGRWEQTVHHFEAAMRLMEQLVQPLDLAQTRYEYADYAQARGDLAVARSLLDAAYDALVGYGTPLFIAECEYRRAKLSLAEGDLDAALASARASYAVQREHESIGEMARIGVVLGGIARARGHIEEARREYERAATTLARSYPDEAVHAAMALGDIAEDDAAALMWYERAVEAAQRARSLVPTEQLAADLARQSAPALRRALHLALRLGRDERALELAEDARAQVALAWLEGQRQLSPADARSREIASRCATLRAAAEELEEHAHHDEEQEQLRRLWAEYEEAVALRRRFGSDAVPGKPEPFRWEGCRAQLEGLGVPWLALAYWLDDDHLTVWQCDRAGIRASERRLSPDERHALALCSDGAASRRAYVYDRDPATLWTTDPIAAHLRRVADLLLPTALADALTPDTLLVIVPAGPAHTLPWGALPLHGEPLIMHATLAVTPSLQVLCRTLAREEAAGSGVLALGVSHHRARPALPHACAEAAMVGELAGADVWCEDEATAARLQAWSSAGKLLRYRMLHIATHAWAGMERGEEAGIALAGGDLGMSDLAYLRLDADLVVLSACESGAAVHHTGEEMVGLCYALLQAGSRALVASLWKVDDAVSLRLMRAVYTAFAHGTRGPWALAHMGRAAHRDGLAPFHWAGYIWMGRP